MKVKQSKSKPLLCPRVECLSRVFQPGSEGNKSKTPSTKSGPIGIHSYYTRSSDGERVTRYVCKVCDKTFCEAFGTPEYGLKRRDLNAQINILLVSNVSLSRVALLSGTTLRTVCRRIDIYGVESEKYLESELLRLTNELLDLVQFDEMESFHHTKLKPLSIPIAVDGKTRKVLWLEVAEIPAKGPLSEISVKKYGKRKDESKEKAKVVLEKVKAVIKKNGEIRTDSKPAYTSWIDEIFNQESSKPIKHRQVKGKRGCIVGQGELKKIGFDPLFSFNHTAAMSRANISRLARKTWNTTKKVERLRLHLMMYVQFHNEVLVPLSQKKAA